MKITKLEKKKRLYLLETNTQQSCYITEDTIVHFFLSKGKDITEQEFNTIQHFAQLSYGKNLALYHLSFKPRTKKEVADYLRSHEIDESTIPKILAELEEASWLNDQAYVEQFLQQNQASGDKGPLVLQQKLTQKGIHKNDLAAPLENQDFDQLAQRVAQKLLKKYQGKLPLKALKDKITHHLMTKGFSYNQAKQAIETLEIETNSEQEEELIYKELDKQYRKYSRKYEGYELTQRLTQALARKGYDFDSIKRAIREYL